MANKKQTRRALWMSVVSLILCCAMLVGTTFAWFTDEVTSGVNKITAGNLDVELWDKNGDPVGADTKLFLDCNGQEIALWEPGVVAYTNVNVANVGTLALKYELSINVADENATTEGGYKLSDVLDVAMVPGGVTATNRQAVLDQAVDYAQDLSKFVESGELYPEGSTLGETVSETYGIVVFWNPNDNAIDNLYNLNNDRNIKDGKYPTTDGEALHIDLGLNLVAAQLVAESDSLALIMMKAQPMCLHGMAPPAKYPRQWIM